MDFSHYTTKPVELAVDLVNADFTTDEELISFLEEHRNMWDGATKPLRKADLDAIRSLRDSLREIFEAADEELAADKVNALLDSYGAAPRLSTHNGTPHLHFEPVESAMVCWLGATTAMGLASVIVEHGVGRFGVCDAGNCDFVYVDTSRNRSRRHCSNTCSTREAVAAYRKRQTD